MNENPTVNDHLLRSAQLLKALAAVVIDADQYTLLPHLNDRRAYAILELEHQSATLRDLAEILKLNGNTQPAPSLRLELATPPPTKTPKEKSQ